MQHELERFGALLKVEPPASLDALVRERMQHVLTVQSASDEGRAPHVALVPPWAPVESTHAQSNRAQSNHRAALEQRAVTLPLIERCVYTVGLMAYGAHAVAAATRLLWRAVVG